MEQYQTAHVSDIHCVEKVVVIIFFPAAIDCGNPIVPEGGQVTFTPGVVMTIETGLGAVTTYTCNEGYNLVGEAQRTCQADEQWDGTVPNCMRM